VEQTQVNCAVTSDRKRATTLRVQPYVLGGFGFARVKNNVTFTLGGAEAADAALAPFVNASARAAWTNVSRGSIRSACSNASIAARMFASL
jgi:hypothetical protein